jgi:hypothetical protein
VQIVRNIATELCIALSTAVCIIGENQFLISSGALGGSLVVCESHDADKQALKRYLRTLYSVMLVKTGENKLLLAKGLRGLVGRGRGVGGRGG